MAENDATDGVETDADTDAGGRPRLAARPVAATRAAPRAPERSLLIPLCRS